MLGNFFNLFDISSLSRFYIAGLSGFYPLEQNAFDAQRKRCQLRSLRSVEQTVTPLLIYDMNGDAVDREGGEQQTNVVNMFDHAQRTRSVETDAAQPRKLAWKVHYLRGADDVSTNFDSLRVA